MDKRTLLAIVLSISVLILWQVMFVPPPPPPGTPPMAPQAANAPAPETPLQPVTPLTMPVPVPPAAAAGVEEVINVETPLYAATFSSRGGTVNKWSLKEYLAKDGTDVNLIKEGGPYDALAVGWDDDYSPSRANFSITGTDLKLSSDRPKGTLVFTHATPQYSIRRTYTFYHDRYSMDIKDEVRGTPEYQITLGGDFGMHIKKESYLHVGPVILSGTDRTDIKPKKLRDGPKLFSGEELKWLALEDKYFCAAIVPKGEVIEAKAWSYQDSAAVSLKAASGVNEFTLYAGPKKQEDLRKASDSLEHIIDYGFFSVISRPIFWLLQQCYKVVGNYGWAIVVLTIIIRIPFIPIVNKGQRSMKGLQKIQPLMKQIREQHKNDPKHMQSEMMNLYKKHKVNPMGGCLPMLLQIPVFFALYKVLMVAVELRGAPWAFWITDLSQKDPFYVLPLVMGASMFLQQKMTPTAGDPKQQKIMMFMPVIFTFLFINFASGLVLYWLVNNLLSIGQQIYVNKKKDN